MQALVGGCGQTQEGGLWISYGIWSVDKLWYMICGQAMVGDLWIAMDKPLDSSSWSEENCRSGIRVARVWWGWKECARFDGWNYDSR